MIDDISDGKGTEPRDRNEALRSELLRNTNSNRTDLSAKSLRNIASQSLAHIASNGSQLSRSSVTDCQSETPSRQGHRVTSAKNSNATTNIPSNTPMTQTVQTANTNPARPTASGSHQAGPSSGGAIPTHIRKCDVCEFDKDVVWERGLYACINCRNFFKRANGRRLECSKDNNCEIIHQPRVKLCSTCRMVKARNLGYQAADLSQADNFPNDGDSIDRRRNQRSIDLIEKQEMDAAIEASMRTFIEENHLDAIDDSILIQMMFGSPIVESPKIQKVYPPQDDSSQIDENGMHPDILNYYGRWFFKGMSNLKPGDGKIKKRQDEIKPTGQKKLVVYNNEVHDMDLALLTTGVNPEEPPPVEVIVTPVINYSPSEGLILAHERNEAKKIGVELPMRAGDAVALRSKPKLTITLKTVRTVIDRRPMLKKTRTSTPNRLTNGHSAGVTSSSLIAPGEDCDESDDSDEYYDTNCNNA